MYCQDFSSCDLKVQASMITAPPPENSQDYLNAFPARNFRLSSVSPLPQDALNFMLRVLATCTQGTFSGTRNGWRPHSAKALSQSMVAQAWGSWLPCTITTTGREGAHTYTEWGVSSLLLQTTPHLVMELSVSY